MAHQADAARKGAEVGVDVADRRHPDYCEKCGFAHHGTADPWSEATASAVRPKLSDTRRLVVAPHCDDEVLGCGGLLTKHANECMVVVLAEPDDIRLKEHEEARAILGYRGSHFLSLADGYVGADMHALVGRLDRLLAELRPTELYLPYPSMHQDHVAAYEAGVRASRLSMSVGHWFTPSVYVYDVAAYDVNLYPTDLKWNVFESLDEQQIDRKVRAAAEYVSQEVGGPHPANNIKGQARSVGSARRVGWAEQFAMVRMVRS